MSRHLEQVYQRKLLKIVKAYERAHCGKCSQRIIDDPTPNVRSAYTEAGVDEHTHFAMLRGVVPLPIAKVKPRQKFIQAVYTRVNKWYNLLSPMINFLCTGFLAPSAWPSHYSADQSQSHSADLRPGSRSRTIPRK